MNSQLTIVTGASSNHFLPLQSLLWTIAKFEPTARVIVYDLGLTADEHDYLEHTPPFFLSDFELRNFGFAAYPPHFSIEQEAGRMAFRPTVLAAIAREFETRNTQNAPRRPVGRAACPAIAFGDGGSSRAVPAPPESAKFPTAFPLSTLNTKSSQLLCWLDSGCQLREPLHEIRACIARDGVYSPYAPGTIETTLHPAARAALGVTADLLPLPIRDAGICGFDLTDVAALCERRKNPPTDRRKNIFTLLNRWAEVALDKNSTAPESSTRRTHRQDAVFAVLLNQAARANNWKLEPNRLRGLAIKQDHLTLTETKYRTLGAPPPASPKPRGGGGSQPRENHSHSHAAIPH